ncbi:GNAT family N-acetyltransferase [soil metagenome]
MGIIPATPEAIPRLAELLGILFDQEEEFFANPEAHAEGLRQIMADPATGFILMAEEEGQILGMVNILLTVSTFLGTRVAILEDLVIDPSHRGRGIGTALIETAIGQARALGCRRISLVTDGSNAPARHLYRKLGFIESTMVPHTLLITNP